MALGVRIMGLQEVDKWVLTLDRTEWKLGGVQVNILMLAVAYRGVAVSLLWKVLGRAGTSSQAQRQALDYYRQRWQIETLFKALKTQGFHLEGTHLTQPDRLCRLLALLSIAFVWCYKAGLYLHQPKPLRIVQLKNDKNQLMPQRLYSFFK